MTQEELAVENYKHNTKMHYEALRKELDIVLTSSIPVQLSNIKTLLWVNFIMIGLVSQLIKKLSLHDAVISFYIFAVISVASLLYSMLIHRKKAYGVPVDIQYMSTFKDNKWTTSKATMQMMRAIRDDLDINYEVIKKRAKLMHFATFFTLLSLIAFVIVFAIS